MQTIETIAGFLVVIFFIVALSSNNWGGTIQNFLFANRKLETISSGLAISSHWFWAIAIFVGPAIAYNWGLIGLLCFAIPNGISLLIVGRLAYEVRDKYPDGYSLTQYIKDNFSRRVSALYQIEFILISFAALLLGFTAVNKLWAFSSLSPLIEPIYANLFIGLITLGFTMTGGIRTSIFTGAIQTLLWTTFLTILSYLIFSSNIPLVFHGKNFLETIFNYKFLTSFAIAFWIVILVGASSHGMMWQKAFSMPKENIIPAFSIASGIFTSIVICLGMISIYAFSAGLSVASSDLSAMVGITSLGGSIALLLYSTMLVGQSSTVIDSTLNYISSLVTVQWLKTDNINTSRLIMFVFVMVAWMISWSEIEIWTILILMGTIRITMFVPLIIQIYGRKSWGWYEPVAFYSSIITVIIATTLACQARVFAMPIYDMYSALISMVLPLSMFAVGYACNET